MVQNLGDLCGSHPDSGAELSGVSPWASGVSPWASGVSPFGPDPFYALCPPICSLRSLAVAPSSRLVPFNIAFLP